MSSFQKTTYFLSFVAMAGIISASTVQADDNGVITEPPELQQIQGETEAYWTKERMESAVPMEAPGVVDEDDTQIDNSRLLIDADPGFMPGWSGRGPQPTEADAVTFSRDSMAPQTEDLQHGSVPTNPETGPYAPFQRWTHFGRYLTFPRSVIGKLFFTLNGGNYVCSGTAINKNAVITAGHCNSSGSGAWATNRLFCPSWNASSSGSTGNPAVGCWEVTTSVTSTAWFSSSDVDYDYACLVTKTTGTVVSDNLGDTVGWAGYAWNFGSTQPIIAHGYAAGSPFSGDNIITVASSEWYTSDRTAGGQVSKYIGSDMTGGSSGGPWMLSWNHKSKEVVDTDGSNATDPSTAGGPHVNGVNSHSRCRTSCYTPPTSTSGTYWQEMGSPPFLNTSAVGESYDVLQDCWTAGGN